MLGVNDGSGHALRLRLLLDSNVVIAAETYAGVLVGSTFKNLVPFVLLMLLLVFRPQGLFGAADVKRV